MNNDELENCIDECYKWIDDVVSKLNDSQKVELLQIFKAHVNTDFFLISSNNSR